MKTLFLSSALAPSTLMTAQVAEEAQAADTTIVEIIEEAVPTGGDVVWHAIKISSLFSDLNEGLITKEEAQAKMDSIISELYLTSASFFENYVPDTLVNGMTVSFRNTALKTNGVQIGIINSSNQMNGVQIGLWNNVEFSDQPKLQIGLWNTINGKSFPILNFRR